MRLFLLFIMMVLTLPSCSNVTIKDSEWFGDLGQKGAIGIHTLTTDQDKISKPAWDKARIGMLCTSVQTFGDLKKSVEQLCSNCNCCTYDETKQVNDFVARAQSVSSKAK